MIQELFSRLKNCGAKGKRLGLKVLKKKPGIGPTKYLGHGPCDSFSRSLSVPDGIPTDNLDPLLRDLNALFKNLKIPAQEVRGFGLSASNLEYPTKELQKSLEIPEKNLRKSNSPDLVVLPPKPSDQIQTIGDFKFGDCFATYERFDAVRDELKEWMDWVLEPGPEHLELLQQYLLQSMRHKNLEDVGFMLRFLDNIAKSNKLWKDGVVRIVACAQDTMKQVYGSVISFR
eukprot:TRINITY_DN3982_c0_g2_i1.p1 TRINITY_DN3982_c0_g2~~TRINITY_DN3982_c0_g2_i1.p1  ORF type:complete len:230 (-),score=56.97 TRINITY_DN3982_c0_g2_i1:80-769(-)